MMSDMDAVRVSEAKPWILEMLGTLYRNWGCRVPQCNWWADDQQHSSSCEYYFYIYASNCVQSDNPNWLFLQWDLQQGKLYQPVYTCKDGLWRYIIDDTLQAVGFHPCNGSLVFKFLYMWNQSFFIGHLLMSCVQLGNLTHPNKMCVVNVIQAINSWGAMAHDASEWIYDGPLSSYFSSDNCERSVIATM